MKRKILAMTLVVTMVIGLTSCGERRRTSRRHSEDVTGSSISAISAEEKEEAVEETANPNAVTLTRLGEIDDPQGKVNLMRVHRSMWMEIRSPCAIIWVRKRT